MDISHVVVTQRFGKLFFEAMNTHTHTHKQKNIFLVRFIYNRSVSRGE
jgi:hypothetical protein